MTTAQRIALAYIRTKFKLLSLASKKKAARAAFRLFCTPQRRTVKPLPPVFKEAESLQLDLEGIRLQGWRWNHPAERKVLLLHGFESSVTNFDRYVRPLVKKGYEVLAFDAPAHGRSAGKQINAPLYKRMIQAIHQQYGPVQSFLAHSFGGLALALALEEISHTAAYRAVFIAPATETSTSVSSFFKFLRLDPALRPHFDLVIIQEGGVSTEWYSINRALKHIRAKVLWIHDETDEITPLRDALVIRDQNFSNVEFVITSGLGHRRIYRDNKVLKSVVDFL